jgi:rsbT co-antagonist protein RsbR
VIAGRERLGAISVALSTASLQAKLASVRDQGLGIALAVAIAGALLALLFSRSITDPLRELTRAAQRLAGGDLTQPIAIHSGAELTVLADAFTTMSNAVQEREAVLQALATSLEQRVAERTAALEQTVAELQETSHARDELQATVRALFNPVVPVLDGVLVMPLIGVIDTERAGVLLVSLLKAIEQHRARIVILDMTGVPLIDTHVARVLLQANNAARLLGARTVLVGLRPELAQTIVALGVDLADLVTQADLQSGVSYALRALGPTESHNQPHRVPAVRSFPGSSVL